jgi:hypothetical protein
MICAVCIARCPHLRPTILQTREIEELEVNAQLAGVSARERHRLKRMARTQKGRQQIRERLGQATSQVCNGDGLRRCYAAHVLARLALGGINGPFSRKFGPAQQTAIRVFEVPNFLPF